MNPIDKLRAKRELESKIEKARKEAKLDGAILKQLKEFSRQPAFAKRNKTKSVLDAVESPIKEQSFHKAIVRA